ncbi:MAG: hypothetical protein GC185_08895 [Alphaproteobacteria bacterium]|nr:hypothetical protein [Alphaproteobacteria bacterium]
MKKNMPPPSRLMPKTAAVEKLGWPATVLFIILVSAIPGAWMKAEGSPLLLSCFVSASFFSAVMLSSLEAHKRSQKLAAERQEETICTFVRQLNCREVDTWIIRAIYEEFLDYFGYPPHLDDRFDKIDPEDIEELAIEISERIGRPLEDTESNPQYGKVHSVRDMILFFTEQSLEERPVETPLTRS